MKFNLVNRPTTEEVISLFSESKKISYQKDEFLFHMGEKVEYLDLLVEGKLQVFKYDNNYNEITLNFFVPTSLIAEWAVINEIPYPASGKFITPSTIFRMPISEFKQKLHKEVKFNHLIMHSLMDKIETLNMSINRGLTMDGLQKVAHFLYHCPDQCKDLKQTQIASMLFLRPETFSRIIKQFKDKDIIDTDKGVIIVKTPEKLVEYF
jgi:CRP/FNR family transcriptional regulator